MQRIMLALLIAGWVGVSLAEDNSGGENAPQPSLAFRLPAPDGSAVELAPQSETQFTVICFLGTECPLARLYAPRLTKLHQQFSEQGVRFLGIDSNSQDSPDDVADYVRDHGIEFPVVKDPGQKVADRFAALRTPEIFVVDQTLSVRYHGRVDDQFAPGVARQQPNRDDLRLALEDLVAGRPVAVDHTEVSGCLIGRRRHSESISKVTFCAEVSRVLNRHCVECHRAGEIGPFALTDYDEVTGWGEMLLESIDAGRMPPWHASARHGEFANARHMPDEDKQILKDWVSGGMPFGDVTELDPLPKQPVEWRLPRPPDMVVEMRDRPFVVPASGTVEYQYFVVDPGFEKETWVSAAQVLPGYRGVVHHAIVFIRPPDGENFRGIGWLTAYVPGQRNYYERPGLARRVPAGSKFVFQMHYTPNGTEQPDLTRVGMNFIPASEVTQEVSTLVALEQEFEIPPQTANFPVPGRVRRLPAQGELLAIVPHMHVRGQSIEVSSRCGDSEQILLDVPRYDFNWQHAYELARPVDLATIDTLEFTARFDNTSRNPANPDPTQYVTWGDQTWEEMAIVFFQVGIPVSRDADGKLSPQKAKSPEVAAAEPQDRTAEIEAFVQDFLKRFDRNQDGIVNRAETPLVFRTYGFNAVDADRDDRLTLEEIRAVARKPKHH